MAGAKSQVKTLLAAGADVCFCHPDAPMGEVGEAQTKDNS